MEIRYQNIILRDMRESDIDDWLRWNCEETAWVQWDAPDEPLEPVDPEKFRREELARFQRPLPEPRNFFEVETADGCHIGMVTSYAIGEDYQWISWQAAHKSGRVRWTLGIDICESRFWSRGYGTMALAAFCKYFLDSGRRELYIQTWSGNERMIRCAQRLGFAECYRVPENRLVRGKAYDSLTFQLDLERFRGFLDENP